MQMQQQQQQHAYIVGFLAAAENPQFMRTFLDSVEVRKTNHRWEVAWLIFEMGLSETSPVFAQAFEYLTCAAKGELPPPPHPLAGYAAFLFSLARVLLYLRLRRRLLLEILPVFEKMPMCCLYYGSVEVLGVREQAESDMSRVDHELRHLMNLRCDEMSAFSDEYVRADAALQACIEYFMQRVQNLYDCLLRQYDDAEKKKTRKKDINSPAYVDAYGLSHIAKDTDGIYV